MPVPSTNPPGPVEHAPIAVDIARIPGMRRLAVDYAQRFDALEPFFGGNPSSASAWADAIARVQAGHHDNHHRGALASLVSAQQALRSAPDPAKENARRLSERGTVAILTGQQAGLFGGPLYTLFKAITAIQLAERVAREHRVTAVPVFWVEAEDHDWNEVRSCTAFDESLNACAVSLPGRPSGTQPVARITLDESIAATLEELQRALAPTEFRDGLVADLRSVYTQGAGMARAFSQWIERLLGPLGLVVYDSSDPAAKPLVSTIFTRELETAGETVRLASEAGAGLAARGYHAQVQLTDDVVALFHLNADRQPIRRDGSGFLVGDQRREKAQLVADASRHPEAFSPNVLLRPIVQDALFPTVAYVAGPNELSYLGQLKGVYQHFNVPMPIMYPRATATILDRAAVKFLERYDVPLESLEASDDALLNTLLARTMPGEVDQAFAEAVRTTDASLARLIKALPLVDSTLEGAGHTTLKKMQQDLETLRSKTIQAAKRRDETLRRQFTRTRAMAFPGGQLQERTIGSVSFLNQYGPALIDALKRTLPLQPGQHWILTV